MTIKRIEMTSNNISLLDSVELALIEVNSDENSIQTRLTGRPNKSKRKKLLESWRTTLETVNDVYDENFSADKSEHSQKRCLTSKLKTTLEQLIARVDEVEIAFSKKNTSGFIFGKTAIIKIIAEYWGPVFYEAIPDNSFAWSYLRDINYFQPFIEQVLIFSDLYEYAAAMLETRDAIEINDGDNYSRLLYQGECLDVTASILYAVVKVFSEPHWCKICFRRASDCRNYCRKHKRGENDGPGMIFKGNRIKECLTSQSLNLFSLYQLRRKLLGESVHVSTDSEQIPFELPIEWRLIRLPLPIDVLEDFEFDSYWKNRNSQWDELFESLPLLSEKLGKKPSSYPSWEYFSINLLKTIQDNDEKTRHALWVLHIAVLAERWFEAERKVVDRRKTLTSVQIQKLLDEGLTQSDIAKRLEITKSAVCKAIKRLKNS